MSTIIQATFYIGLNICGKIKNKIVYFKYKCNNATYSRLNYDSQINSNNLVVSYF